MPEISEHELAVKNKALAILEKMAADPKEGMSFKKKIKALVPDANFPELDIVENEREAFNEKISPVIEENKKLKERLDAWEQNQKNSKEESELQSQLDSVRKQYNFTADGMQKVIDRMKEKNNPDADAAAAWVARAEAKAKPVSDSVLMPSALNLYGSHTEDADFAELNKDPQGWADRKVVQMLNEFSQSDAA